MTTTSPAALTIAGLEAGYTSNQKDRASRVLKGITLEVPRGELLAILGPSGCGKSTLLRVIAGLLPATAGTIDLGGRRVVDGKTSVPPEQRRVGLVPQEAALFPHLTVAKNVEFGLKPRKNGPAVRLGMRARRARVADMLELAGIAQLADAMPHELSGGQAQRVALARALAPSPDLVLLDEPFSALDASLRVRLRNDVRKIIKEAGATGLLVTHDQDEALSIADRVAVMNAGHIIQCGSPDEVYNGPADAWVACFLGTCSLLSGTSIGQQAQCALGQIPSATRDGAVQILARPEQLRLRIASQDPTENGVEGAEAIVMAAEYQGHSTLYTLKLTAGGEEMVAREQGWARFNLGDHVLVSPAGNLHVIPQD